MSSYSILSDLPSDTSSFFIDGYEVFYILALYYVGSSSWEPSSI
jgi:hypothetical protein